MYLGQHEGDPEDYWPIEFKLVSARVGMEKGVPWLCTKFYLGNEVMGLPWYRAHCMN